MIGTNRVEVYRRNAKKCYASFDCNSEAWDINEETIAIAHAQHLKPGTRIKVNDLCFRVIGIAGLRGVRRCYV